MGRAKGRDVLIKMADDSSPPQMASVAGIKSKNLSLTAAQVDGTDSESVDGWREIVCGAGVKSAAIAGSGVFRDAASDALLRQAFFDQIERDFELTLPDFGVLAGKFLIERLDYSGDYDDHASFSISLISTGPIGFTAL